MGKSSPSPPAAPDPYATAAAQGQMNAETARTQARLSRVNQTTPYGSISYNQDPNNPDIYSQDVHLSPAEQRNLDLTQQGQGIYGQTAVNQLGAVQNALSRPIETDYSRYRDQATDARMSRLEPQFRQDEESMRAHLMNSGITEGSAAWDNAYRPFNQGRTDARLQALAQGDNAASQAAQTQIALRGAPINEAAALLSGQQVQVPQLTQSPGATVAPTDFMGAQNTAYQGQMSQYNSQMQAHNANLGGVYGLLGTGLTAGAMMLGGPVAGAAAAGAMGLARSDERLKEDIAPVGKTGEGTPIYTYKYRDDPTHTTHMGVMAQELMHKRPDAVHRMPSGFYAVDYRKVA